MQIISEIKIIRKPANQSAVVRTRSQSFCLKCRTQVGLVNTAHAAEFMKTAKYQIYEFADQGKIHLVHNSKGDVMVCFNSILEFEADYEDISEMKTIIQIDLAQI